MKKKKRWNYKTFDVEFRQRVLRHVQQLIQSQRDEQVTILNLLEILDELQREDLDKILRQVLKPLLVREIYIFILV